MRICFIFFRQLSLGLFSNKSNQEKVQKQVNIKRSQHKDHMADLSKVVRGQNDENRPQVLSKNNSMKKRKYLFQTNKFSIHIQTQLYNT